MNKHPLFAMLPKQAIAIFHVVALVAILTCLLLVLVSAISPTMAARIEAKDVQHWNAKAYAVSATQLLPHRFLTHFLSIAPDSSQSPNASRLQLFEDGRRLGPAHSIHTEISELGGGRFSHWGNDIVFSTSDGTDPRANGRTYSIKYQFALFPIAPWILLVAGSLIGVLGHQSNSIGMQPTQLSISERAVRLLSQNSIAWFWLGTVLACWYLNWIFTSLIPAPIPSPDTEYYLIWSLFRTVGYPALLELHQLVFRDWSVLPLLQLNLLLAGLVLLSHAVSVVTGSRLLGWAVMAVVIAAGNMLLSAADLMTEAAFSAFVMLHVACFTLYLHRKRAPYAVAAGLFLVSAVLIKSVAIVLIGPLILFFLFHGTFRRQIGMFLLLPTLASWATPSTYNYFRHGFFESSMIGGYALAGHVAWAIRARDGSAYAAESASIANRIQPVLQKRPAAWSSVGQYVNYTANEYNTLLWANMVPELDAAYVAICHPDKRVTCSWASCPDSCQPTLNKAFMGMAKEAIAAEWLAYARHVAAHDYGLWRDSFGLSSDFLRGSQTRADSMQEAYGPSNPESRRFLGPLPPLKQPNETMQFVSSVEGSSVGQLMDLILLRKPAELMTDFLPRVPVAAFLASLVACVAVFKIRHQSSATQACCYCALVINAYFLGTALAQPSLHRYAWAMQGVYSAGLVLFAYVLAVQCWRVVRNRMSACGA